MDTKQLYANGNQICPKTNYEKDKVPEQILEIRELIRGITIKIADELLHNNDIAEWAKQLQKPAYTASEVGAEASGSASKALADAKEYADNTYMQATEYTDLAIAALINGAPSTRDTLKKIADAMAENEDVVQALEAAIGAKANEAEFQAHQTNGILHTSKTEKEDWDSAKEKADEINIGYGTCDTAADDAAKVVTLVDCPKWKLKAGSMAIVRFSYNNTAQSPTLNVNDTGAKRVAYDTKAITTENLFRAGFENRWVMYVYDGTQYVYMGCSIDLNSTYQTGTALKAGIAKLYSETGTNTDGTMTQAAVTALLNEMKANFQGGCSTISGKLTSLGIATAENASPEVIAAAIQQMYDARYNAGANTSKVGTALSAQVLTGYTFTNANGIGINGSMPNKGAVSQALNCGGSYTIPSGYHNGNGKVTANSLASQTQATATAANITKDKTAYINGTKVTGTGADNTSNYNNGYNAGVTAADARVNTSSKSYIQGYNAGVASSQNTGKLASFSATLTPSSDVISKSANYAFAINNAKEITYSTTRPGNSGGVSLQIILGDNLHKNSLVLPTITAGSITRQIEQNKYDWGFITYSARHSGNTSHSQDAVHQMTILCK